ncbi:hypothetical protein OY671_011833, partial [Metschnikowia pulcherrima]
TTWATSAWRIPATAISPRRSGALPPCSRTASSRPCWPASAMCRAWTTSRSSLAAPSASTNPPSGKRWAWCCRPANAAPTKPRATSRPGSSAGSSRNAWARTSAAPSPASPASASSSRWIRCTSKGWCTCPSWAASTSSSTMRCTSCAAS